MQVCQPFSYSHVLGINYYTMVGSNILQQLYTCKLKTIIILGRYIVTHTLFCRHNYNHINKYVWNAELLYISLQTVSNHIEMLFQKQNIFVSLLLCLGEDAPFITFTNVNERFRGTRLRENICIYFIYGEKSARAMCLNIFRF